MQILKGARKVLTKRIKEKIEDRYPGQSHRVFIEKALNEAVDGYKDGANDT